LEWPGFVIGVSAARCTELTVSCGRAGIAAVMEQMRSAPSDAWHAALACEPMIPQAGEMLINERLPVAPLQDTPRRAVGGKRVEILRS
jgi:hypothetical protein